MYELSGFQHKYVTTKAIRRAEELIEQFDLHHNPNEAINISPLLDQFDLRFLELPATTLGLTLDEGGDRIIIALNDQLDAATSRFVSMHEVGHVALWHPDQLSNCIEGEWVVDERETEASTFAAMLLIPKVVIENTIESLHAAQQLAAQYVVPLEVVLVRLAIYQATNL